MTKFRISFALIVMLLFSSSAMAILVGKVDIQKVLVTVEQGKKIRSQLKKKFDEKQKIIKKEEDKIRKLQADFKKQSLVMNDKAKRKKERDIQQKIIKLQQKTMEYQKEIQGLEQKLKRPILENVRVIVDEVSKKANVDMTFEVSTAPIVYAKESKDLTDEVISLYNKKHK